VANQYINMITRSFRAVIQHSYLTLR